MSALTAAAAPLEDLGGDGPLLHFAHANGFPPRCYTPLLQRLAASHHVIAAQARPLWDATVPRKLRWTDFADDLLATLEGHGVGPVIGVGHSLGAVATVLAAARAPERFRALVLIEPVFLPPWLVRVMGAVPRALRRRTKMVRTAAARRERYPSRDAAYASFRPKRVFAGLDDAALRALVTHMFADDPAGDVVLAFPRAWEAAIYANLPRPWRALRDVTLPVLGLRGATSNTLFPAAWARWQRRQPHGVFHEIASRGHLLPLEAPIVVGDLINGWTPTVS